MRFPDVTGPKVGKEVLLGCASFIDLKTKKDNFFW